jgi:hypothetical protein
MGPFVSYKENEVLCVWLQTLTGLFLDNLRKSSISWSVCPWEAFPAKCNVTHWLNGLICIVVKELDKALIL